MSTYVHKCQACPAKPVEATYPMSCVGAEEKLPVDLRRTISCNPVTCRHRNRRGKRYPIPVPPGTWPRVPQVPQLAGASGGTFKTEKELAADKKKVAKLRSRLQFMNDEVPHLSKREQRKYRKKWSHLKGDHEKIKLPFRGKWYLIIMNESKTEPVAIHYEVFE